MESQPQNPEFRNNPEHSPMYISTLKWHHWIEWKSEVHKSVDNPQSTQCVLIASVLFRLNTVILPIILSLSTSASSELASVGGSSGVFTRLGVLVVCVCVCIYCT